ncbi:hypothetical protein ZWY2020_028107 [Hordeum vulgare]|nr:hypothetical protein ZWY2020_028107 [Hordeum vulgare]
MYEHREEDAGEDEIPIPPKKKKLMADAMKSAPKPPSNAKKVISRRKTTKDIPVAAKEKGPDSSAPAAEGEEDENAPILRKLRPTLPVHNAAHLVAEDMRKRKDVGLSKWRVVDPYVVGRRTVVDPRFHTKEQQDFYETVLFDKNPPINDMRYVDWEYIKENEIFFPHIQENFRLVDIEDFVGKEMTPWNDKLIMQFYSTVHFHGDGSLVWMSDGHKYESTIDDWATIIGSPKQKKSDVDVYSEAKMSHNTMANMYKPIPDKYLASHKMGSLYFLQAGIPTTNTILRHTLMPKSGDDRMILGHSINLLHHLDSHTRFRGMDLIVETIWRTAPDQKRSCGYAPYIQMLINAKLGKHAYLLDHPHLPLQPEFEDNVVVMDENDPSPAAARMAAQEAEPEAARNEPPPVPHLRTQAEQISFLVSSVQGMEKNIQEILQSHKSLERVVETKFHDMDVKVTKLTTIVK